MPLTKTDPWADVRVSDALEAIEESREHDGSSVVTITAAEFTALKDDARIIETDADALLAVKTELQNLIASSTGVDGLHLNEDLATWDELLNGPYQWLGALAALPEHLKLTPQEGREG